MSTSWDWHRLAHVCQRWRLIVFASPRSLDLQLYCTPRTLVKNTCCWPALPIAIRCRRSHHGKHNGDEGCEHLSPEDEDNIVATLQHGHNRVRSIKLCLTNSLVEKLSTQVKEPLSELEALVLRSISNRYFFHSNLPFRWSPRLRVLHLTDISLLSLPPLLSSSPNLVDLQLHTGCIRSCELPSPVALANALSVMTQLESLSLRSDSFLYPRTHTGGFPPSGRRVVLPALTRLKFRGFSQYLECLVAEIDAPCLAKIEITFAGHVSSLSEIGQFINLIEAQRLHRRAVIQTSANYISIRFTPSGVESPSYFVLGMYHTRLDRQLSSMARVCNLLPPSLLGTGDLGIVTGPPPSESDTVDGEGWLRLLRQFRGAERFYVAGGLATDIMHALLRADGEFATVLPALRELDVAMEPEPLCAALQATVTSFATSRQLSESPLKVEYRPPLA
ncbi:hypothetical protein EDB84DRAFT_896932 [Lactarius hengduanensis]|nr:hypothetical protein EDB84DRAFT_896932 [Lactarius hengduanensis]